MRRSLKPRLAVLAGAALFHSFFDETRRRRLGRSFDWARTSARKAGPALRSALAEADAIITTWDSPRFGPELTVQAPSTTRTTTPRAAPTFSRVDAGGVCAALIDMPRASRTVRFGRKY